MTAEQIEILDVDEEDETFEYNNTNRIFNNPSQSDKPSSGERFICESCDFTSAMKDVIENHNELIHTWCTQCDASFTSKKKLKSHIKKVHGDK